MTSLPQQPPFLRGDIEGVLPIVSVWLRNLQEVEEIVDKWAADLNPEGFWWVPSEAANPIGGLIRHIGGASYRLWLRGSGQEIPDHIKIKPADEMALRGEVGEVLAEFRERMELVKKGLSGLSEADLNRTAVFPATSAKAIYVFDHIAGHAQQHAGQIITTRKLWDRR